MPQTLVAIDPGRSGAIVHWKQGMGDPRVQAMPDSDQAAVKALQEIDIQEADLCILGIEKPPRFTGAQLPGSRIALLFQNFGALFGAATALEWEVRMFMPQSWQKGFSLGSSAGLQRSVWKAKLKAVAIGLYPRTKVTNDNADALLILHHLRTVLSSAVVLADDHD